MPEDFPWRAVWDVMQEHRRKEQSALADEKFEGLDAAKTKAVYEAGTRGEPVE